jgi:hypothetical protein
MSSSLLGVCRHPATVRPQLHCSPLHSNPLILSFTHHTKSMAAPASSSSASGGASVDYLSPASALVDPPQCSLWFEPKEWSRRYADTFFTADVVADETAGASAAGAGSAPAGTMTIQMKAGDNAWTVSKTPEQFEQLAKQVRPSNVCCRVVASISTIVHLSCCLCPLL